MGVGTLSEALLSSESCALFLFLERIVFNQQVTRKLQKEWLSEKGLVQDSLGCERILNAAKGGTSRWEDIALHVRNKFLRCLL